ncbi:fimbrial protein [Pantoea sp. C2G6]|uniref:fimbrial protein n=1 Tax=Pantoea sp. C2G6 TaxID=3243084 RepID=UPI003ED968CC
MSKFKKPVFQQLIATLSMLFIFSLFFIHLSASAVTNNLQFSGNLVADPCELDPTTQNIEVDFGEIVDKYFYINQRVHSKPFVVRLLECDLSLGSTVSLTFTGTADSELNDMLAVTGSASGVAIGMEDIEGKILPFNQPTPVFALTAGTTELTLMAYVQARPSAIQNHTIVRGEFNATANFTLNYE